MEKIQEGITEFENCKNCDNGLECNYNMPTIDCFLEHGVFSHIKLPIPQSEFVPSEILKYIYGSHYDDGGGVKPRHEKNIKIYLNKLHSDYLDSSVKGIENNLSNFVL